jgi:hypothetical protein
MKTGALQTYSAALALAAGLRAWRWRIAFSTENGSPGTPSLFLSVKLLFNPVHTTTSKEFLAAQDAME